MSYELVHRFYHNGECILELGESYWYDTPSPYIACANRLFEINERIRKGEELLVVSRGKEFLLKTEDDLVRWITTEFNTPAASGFEEHLRERLK